MKRFAAAVCACVAMVMIGDGRHAAAAASTPFTGTALAIPGLIPASDFDNGGEGVAYHDTTSGNKGGVYRLTDVDLEPSADGGYNIGKIAVGEWLNYSVNVATAGAYSAIFRVASLGQGGTFHLEMNGVNVTGALVIPNTGGWQIWQSVTATLALTAGARTARLVMDTSSAAGVVGNINSMRFALAPAVSTPYSGTRVSLPSRVQAENFDNGSESIAYHDTTSGNSGGAFRSTDVDLEPASPGGYDVGWTTAGEWLNYSVDVAASGTYTLNVRVAASGAGGTFHIEMNGTNVSGSLTVPDTGGWQSWQTVSRPVTLNAGPQFARLVMDTTGARAVGNFDWFEVVSTATSTPPGSGVTTTVPAGGNLQAAIDAAQPGDTLLLAPGAVYRGSFVLPLKGGASYITIRSGAPDAMLPASGVRVGPSNVPNLAKVEGGYAGMPAFVTAARAHHYRLMFLEIVNTYAANDIIQLGDGGPNQTTLASVAHDLIVDRCYIHGDPINGQKRGVALNSASTTISNSYISNIKSSQYEAQALLGWNGPGPYLIINNYLEGAGENVMFGGQDPFIPGLVPSDITLRQNYISKPLAWRGQQWVVKNLMELKNAQRVTVDGNLFENSWAAAQQGYAILLTPRNQDGTAPWSVVQQVQFTNNVVRHVAAVFNILGTDDVHSSQATNAITIRNNLTLDVSGATWGGGPGWFLLMNGGRNITVDHNTVFTDSTAVVFADGAPVSGFTFTNNIVPDNAYAITGNGLAAGNSSIATFFPGAVVRRNVFITGHSSTYPTDNYFPSSITAVGFVDLINGNYRLGPTSPYRSAATDGTSIGFDQSAVEALMRFQ